ncbi:MAG: hypothetical protein EOO77_41825 [Oxalobacteraceae bacterium]|nr:MAG: hypothetical protein EOO77_41825 [Oxalobacteraceae bacterium]
MTLDRLWFVAFNITPHTLVRDLIVRRKTTLCEKMRAESKRLGNRLQLIEAAERDPNIGSLAAAAKVVAKKLGWRKEWEVDVPKRAKPGAPTKHVRGRASRSPSPSPSAAKRQSSPAPSSSRPGSSARLDPQAKSTSQEKHQER